MSVLRLPLLYAFAGGCLCSAALFGMWRAEAGVNAPAVKQRTPPDVELVTAVVNAAMAKANAEQHRDRGARAPTEEGRVRAEEPAPQAAQSADDGGPAPAGSAVSDVLTSLEAAYRAHVASTAKARVPSSSEHALATAASDHEVSGTESPPAAAKEATTAIVPISPAANIVPVAAAPVASTPAAVAPVAVAVAPIGAPPAAPPPAIAPPPVAAIPAFVGQADLPPSQVHIGDFNQNTYITNVRHGDVYLIQMQQLAMLQYMQLLGMSAGFAAPVQRSRGAAPRATPFSTTLTNPDNPWGFRFSPPNLVH